MAGGDHVPHADVKVVPGTEKAQPGHAGVQLDMDPERLSQLPGSGGILLCLRQGADGLGQILFDQQPRVLRRRVPQDQDRHGDAAPAQLQRLIQAAHGQVVRSGLLQQAGDGQRAVPVGVGLHHAQKAAALRQRGADGLIIVADIGQGDLRPASLL